MYENVIRAVMADPWAIREQEFAVITALIELRARGEKLSPEDVQARLEEAAISAGPRAGARATGAIAVVPVYGTIMPRASLMADMSGGTSVQGLTKAFRAAMADEGVGSIVLDVDSPGGQVGGIEELAAEIRAARGTKPIVAVANYTMASAAYWIASAADEIVASPSSLVGSIGVLSIHQEASQMAEKLGVTTTITRRPPSKADANEFEPLTDDAKAELQQRVDDYYNQFVGAVAKGRGVTAAAVRDGYGQGRVLTAKRALDAGLVDRIDTLDGVIRRLASGKAPATRGAMAVEAVDLDDAPDLAELADAVLDEATQEAQQPAVDPLEIRRLKARAHAR